MSIQEHFLATIRKSFLLTPCRKSLLVPGERPFTFYIYMQEKSTLYPQPSWTEITTCTSLSPPHTTTLLLSFLSGLDVSLIEIQCLEPIGSCIKPVVNLFSLAEHQQKNSKIFRLQICPANSNHQEINFFPLVRKCMKYNKSHNFPLVDGVATCYTSTQQFQQLSKVHWNAQT